MLEFNTDEFEKQIEIKLPQTPHLVKEEDIEIELFNSLEVDISSSALVGALCNHQMAITYDRIFRWQRRSCTQNRVKIMHKFLSIDQSHQKSKFIFFQDKYAVDKKSPKSALILIIFSLSRWPST